MLEPFASVVVIDMDERTDSGTVVAPDLRQPSYCYIGHNLNRWDADRLAERLAKQYSLTPFVVYHRNRHEEAQAPECDVCQLLFEEIIERAGMAAKARSGQPVQQTQIVYQGD